MGFGNKRKQVTHTVPQEPVKPYATVKRTGVVTYRIRVFGYATDYWSGGFHNRLTEIYDDTAWGRGHAHAKSKRILARHLRRFDRTQEPEVRYTTKDV